MLTYHRIGVRPDPLAFADDVFDATPHGFDYQVGWLASEFNFVTARDVVAWFRGRALPKNPILLTFDDGYAECIGRALPILGRHGARATFFVSPEHLDRRRLFWWDRIARIVGRSEQEELVLRYPRAMRLPLRGDANAAIAEVLACVKRTPGLDLERLLDDLATAARVSWSEGEEREAVDRELMSWADVLELERCGMDVESHTQTHRVLQTLGPSDLMREFGESRERLEAVLGRRVEAMAYPVGYPVGHLDHVRAALMASGYHVGFTNHSGASRLSRDVDPFGIRRIAMSGTYDGPLFSAIALSPRLAPQRSRASFASG